MHYKHLSAIALLLASQVNAQPMVSSLPMVQLMSSPAIYNHESIESVINGHEKISQSQAEQLLKEICTQRQVDYTLAAAFIDAENAHESWDQYAHSNAGAVGFAQITKGASLDYFKEKDVAFDMNSQPDILSLYRHMSNPETNLDIAVWYLTWLGDVLDTPVDQTSHSDRSLLAVAYNAGPSNAIKYGRHAPFKETKAFQVKLEKSYQKRKL